MIYILESDGLYKIGHSKNPFNRTKDLQTGNGREIKFICAFKCINEDREAEAQLHSLLERHRAHGEWFKSCPEIEALIEVVTRESCLDENNNPCRQEFFSVMGEFDPLFASIRRCKG